MKKILSISVVALLVTVPTVGWAVPDRPEQDQEGVKSPEQLVELNATQVTDAAEHGSGYVTSRTTVTPSGLTADEGFKEGSFGMASVVSTQEPKYNVEEIDEEDGTEISTLSYVKGAYNDVITKINKVHDYKTNNNNLFNLHTRWAGDDDDIIKVSLATVNNIPTSDEVVLLEDDRCPDGYLLLPEYKTGNTVRCTNRQACVNDPSRVQVWDSYFSNRYEEVCMDWGKYVTTGATNVQTYGEKS